MNKHAREEVSLIDGRRYCSEDHWVTVYRLHPNGQMRRVTGPTADRIRYIAVVQHGGGRNEVAKGGGESRSKEPRPEARAAETSHRRGRK